MKHIFLLTLFISLSSMGAEIEYVRIVVPSDRAEASYFNEQYLNVVDGNQKLRQAMNDGLLKYEEICVFDVGDGSEKVKEDTENTPYFELQPSGLYSLKNKIVVTRRVISSYRFQGPVLFPSLRSTVSVIKRRKFDAVPDWDIGEPDVSTFCELDLGGRCLIKGWNIVKNQKINEKLILEAVRFNSSDPEAKEFNLGNVKESWIPVD